MAAEQTFLNTKQFDTEESTEAVTTPTKNFQNEVRQWFTALSPEERAAALGFEDDFPVMAALMARIASPAAPSSTASNDTQNNNDNRCDEQRNNVPSISIPPTYLLPPKRTTDKPFSNESYDWEARIAIEIIEKTWEEIMMVGAPNTSGVNQKEFVKNSLKQHDEETNADQPIGETRNSIESIGETRNSIESIDDNDSNAMENQTEESEAEQKSCSNKSSSKLNDFSDAYRIPNEGVDVEGKTASATAKETDDQDLGPSVPTVTESCEPGNEGEKGKAKNDDIDIDVGSSPTPGVEDETNNQCALASPVSSQEFAATATTTTTISSPSAMHGIETGLQYLSNTNDSRRIAEVMENTRCIFPAASKIATATITGDHNTSNELLQQHQQKQKQPFMTMNPSYLHCVTGDELLVAFDEIMAMAFTDSSSDEPCSFILPEEATSASWIDLLRSYATTDVVTSTSTPLQSIPLYILLLCRFQYSLARSYSGRSLAQPNQNDQIGDDSQSISHESAAQWLTALMTRIRELETMESTGIQRLLSKLSSKMPEAGDFVEGDTENQKHDLEQYLLLPFTVVAERLGKDSVLSSDYVDILKEIDLGIEESLQDDDLIASEKDHSVAATVSVCDSESAQDGDLVSSESTELPSENESQIFPNNGFNATSSGSRKTKKKKKKKKRKGGVGATTTAPTKTTTIEKIIETETKIEDEGESEEKEDVIEPSVEILTENNCVKEDEEDAAAIIDAQVDEYVPVTESKILTVPALTPETETSDLPAVNAEEVEVVTELPEKSETENQNVIYLSRADGSVSGVHAPPKPSNEEVDASKTDSPSKETQNTNHDDHEDKWETVEIRPRGRKKISDKGNSTRPGSQHNGNNSSANGLKKKNPRTKETRAKTKTRKMVREILGGVLDAVEEKVRRKRTLSRDQTHIRRNQTSFASANGNSLLPIKNSSSAAISQSSNTQQKTGSSLRDILVRGKGNNHNQQSKNPNTTKSSPFSYSERARSLMASDSNEGKNNIPRRKNEKPSHITGSKTAKALKAARALPADQSTIPTIASTNSAFTPSVTNVTSRKPGVALSSDSSESESAEAQKLKNTPSDPVKFASPSPPLPTLLSPGNNNSTSSSVASSLDAPHAGHHGNKSRQSENDVGCHLLDVCDKLSSEIAVFMKRREDALTIRRHERGLVLTALEKTLGLIWPGKPSVEMYGSCATNLDLPSSDLDVVVCGLNSPFVDIISSNSPSDVSKFPGNTSPVEELKNREDGSPDLESRKEGPSYTSDRRYSQHQMTRYQMQMMYGHMSTNAERVLRLAMELEHQPWAVHVKAIPTASVPVIKILADPARLQGALMNGNAEWLVQQPINGQSPPSMTSHGFTDNANPRSGNQAPMSHFQNQQSSPLWRGADVVNGLLKVDITFEGPEHGGIGSTKFSTKVIEDFASETALSPECTPQVQVLMVLKELLAQRRSNEPFSGGLSSYALLLLVISMIGERSIIREELEKTERQRRVVAAGGGNSALRSTPIDSMESIVNEFKQAVEKGESKKTAQSKPEDIHTNYTKAATQQNDSITKNTGKAKESLKNTAWQERQEKQEQQKPTKKTGAALLSPPLQRKSPAASSWASIARNKASSANLAASKKRSDISEKNTSESNDEPNSGSKELSKKPSSFADAVAKGKPIQVSHANSISKKVSTIKKNEGRKRFDGLLDPPSSKSSKSKIEKEDTKLTKVQQSKGNVMSIEETKARTNAVSSTSNQSKGPSVTAESNLNGPLDSSGFPQGFDDVIEVLCSGETTPGKLLMHFLLFYGQHFESQSTAIDYSGTHPRDAGANNGYSVRSSYMIRRNAGSYDPVTGMYTVDPIVVYDPLEGAENNNVARSCFAWSSIRWVFAQSYMTLSSAAEQNASDGTRNRAIPSAGEGPAYGHDESGHVVVDPSSPLLELLLSF